MVWSSFSPSGGLGVEHAEYPIGLEFVGPLDAFVLSVQVLCEQLDVCCFDHCEGVINILQYN